MSEILEGIIIVIVSITLYLIVVAIKCESKEEAKEDGVQSEEKIKLNAKEIRFMKPHQTHIGQGGRLVLVLEAETHKIGLCLTLDAIEQLYENLGTLLKIENLDFEGGEDDWVDEADEGLAGSEMPQIKTKISFKKERSEFKNLYS